ncbi:MAG TPA: SGNH/GDSL hydrolase family protein [Bacillota bacterium]|nr:SGNH/GDSL hydrolase family protein [Bacillota bacterium]
MNMKEIQILPAFTVDQVQDGSGWRLVTPADPDLYSIGRIDTRVPEAPVFIWQGTEIRARFSGRRIGFRFSGAWGQNFFNVIIDGKIRVLLLTEGGTHDYLLSGELPDGLHELILYKRTEGKFSNSIFQGIILEEMAQLEAKPEPLPLCIEFYGDSITVGACNEDAGPDQYNDFSTHNNYRSYGAITARALSAEYVCIAISGVGVCYSWNTLLLGDIYDRLYPDLNSPKFAFSGRIPDIVVLNIGQNDYGYSVTKDVAFPTDFTEKYVGLIRNIRSLYPDARIVCAMGGMSAYNDSAELRAGFTKAVAELQAADGKIFSLSFTPFTYNHPRVDTHEKMATELTAFLKKEVLRK